MVQVYLLNIQAMSRLSARDVPLLFYVQLNINTEQLAFVPAATQPNGNRKVKLYLRWPEQQLMAVSRKPQEADCLTSPVPAPSHSLMHHQHGASNVRR